MSLQDKVSEAIKIIQEHAHVEPQVGLILGSGLGDLAEDIKDASVIPYKDIPYFPESTVAGHKGQLVIGELNGKQVVAMQGRFHFYEGYNIKDVTFPVRVMQGLGVHRLIVTNACGGMNQSFEPGDLMIINDHLNMTGENPLIGKNDETFGPRFPDMSEAYSKDFKKLAKSIATKEDIKVQEGVYAGITGPSFNTPAELIMLRHLGADAVGMSTVPEVIVANHMGMEVLGISCVTDMAIGEALEPLTHDQVVAVADQTKPTFIRLVRSTLEAM